MALCNGRALRPPRKATRQSGRTSGGDMILAKERPDMTSNPLSAATFRRLRPDSDRAVRLMRLELRVERRHALQPPRIERDPLGREDIVIARAHAHDAILMLALPDAARAAGMS